MTARKLLDQIHPGEILSEDFMKPMGISISKLARDIGVSPGRYRAISDCNLRGLALSLVSRRLEQVPNILEKVAN